MSRFEITCPQCGSTSVSLITYRQYKCASCGQVFDIREATPPYTESIFMATAGSFSGSDFVWSGEDEG